jgi:hypothetical protein
MFRAQRRGRNSVMTVVLEEAGSATVVKAGSEWELAVELGSGAAAG